MVIVEGTPWLAIQISFSIHLWATHLGFPWKCYYCCRNKWVKIIFLCYIISLFLCEQFTSVLVGCSGSLPHHFVARLIYATSHLHFSEQFIIMTAFSKIAFFIFGIVHFFIWYHFSTGLNVGKIQSQLI